jgi:hypothetical protein
VRVLLLWEETDAHRVGGVRDEEFSVPEKPPGQ